MVYFQRKQGVKKILVATAVFALAIISIFAIPRDKTQRTVQSVASLSVDVFNRDPMAWLAEAELNLCSSEFPKYTEILRQLDFETLDRNYMGKNGVEWLKKSFAVKREFNRQLDSISAECRKSLVHFFRELRQVEDYVGELAYREKDRSAFDVDFKKVPPPILDPKSYSPFQVSPEFSGTNGFQFEAGDVVITRGISFISATISQSTDDRTHYSHGVFIHKTKSGEIKTIESYLQRGVEYYSLVDAMKNENARIMVFRAKDRELAARASKIMGEKLDSANKAGTGIPYDYDIDVVDHSKMTCAEIIVSSYEWASNGQFKIPFSTADVRFKNPYVLDKLNIAAGPTFSPINMEVDPRFDLVLEWRDYSLVRDQRQKDIVLRKVLDWMDKDNYQLLENFTTVGLRTVWATRRVPVLWNVLSRPVGLNTVPKDTPTKFLVSVAQLKKVGEILLEEVKKTDLEYQKVNGYPMSEKRLMEFLEKFRENDAKNYKTGRKTYFHRIFRPKH